MILKDQDAIRSRTLNRITVHQDLTRALRIESRNQMQQGRFPAAGWTNDAEKFSRANLEINMIESDEPFAGLRAITKTYLAQTNLRNLHGGSRAWLVERNWTWLGASAAVNRKWELTGEALRAH
jgi:hypothetical protein